jgi:adenylate kinase
VKLLIVGRPGAGKGTQASMIGSYYQIPHISTGEIFREAIKQGTKLGTLAKSYIDAGNLVPDEVTIGLVEERLLQDDCKKSFLLDGFPRNLNQAKALDKFLSEHKLALDLVLNVDVEEDILVKRMTGRRVCKGCGETYNLLFNPPLKDGVCDKCGSELFQRSDDTEETFKNRLFVYEENTAPLIHFYETKGIMKTVNGDQPLDDVFGDVKNLLDNLED